ncbi:hypothetical protein [Paraglaciecola sp.]|uniref:hypothetical protein n=1 Tax=Paraglaciecola sp. TaxID=1920173 RepID=UPI0030F46A12
MTSQSIPNKSLSDLAVRDESKSPHWPKTIVSSNHLSTELQKPDDNTCQHNKSLSTYLKNLRPSRR